jgi:HlyD family secretion protein
VGAEAEIRSFERDLEKAIIRSPVDGVVLTRSIEVGQTVAASFTAPLLFTIAEDLKKMELVVSVAEADIGRVAIGQAATFSVDAWPSRIYTAAVKKVSFATATPANNGNSGNPGGSNGVVTYSTELEVANDDLSLRPGMTATVDISIISKKNVMLVPNAALRFDPVAAAEIGKPVDTNRTLVQRLSPGGGRRWWGGGNSPPKSTPASNGPRFWTLKEGKPVEVAVKIGITDGRFTEILDDEVGGEMTAIVSVKPADAS